MLVIRWRLGYVPSVTTGSTPVFQQGRPQRCLTLLGALLLLAGTTFAADKSPNTVDFNRDIRRILSENCFKCHGPDPKERKGGLRLDSLEGAQVDLGGYRAIVPGQPDKSELVRRITATDPDDKMPPPKSGKKLTPAEIALLRAWIKQGATYARHWSYIKPVRPALPRVQNKSWAKN